MSKTAAELAAELVAANRFDTGDDAYAARVAQVAYNLSLISQSAGARTPKAPVKQTKSKPGQKAKPKQTKTPSQIREAKDEAEAKKRKPKVKPGQKSPAAIKRKTDNERSAAGARSGTRTGTARKGSGVSGHHDTQPKVKEGILTRWPKMTQAARSSYIQAKAGPTIKTADADEALSKVWSKMSLAQQRAHIKRHPNSRLRLNKAKAKGVVNTAAKKGGDFRTRSEKAVDTDVEGVPGPKDHKPIAWWTDQTPEFQQKYLNKYPQSKFAVHHRTVTRNLSSSAAPKIRAEARKIGDDYHNGIAGIKSWRDGDDMTPEQKEGLKRTASKVGGLLILALVGVALFTPLGPAAMEFGETWLNERQTRTSESSESLSGVNLKDGQKKDSKAEGDRQINWMVSDMTEFLLKQDPAKLAKKMSKIDKSHHKVKE